MHVTIIFSDPRALKCGSGTREQHQARSRSRCMWSKINKICLKTSNTSFTSGTGTGFKSGSFTSCIRIHILHAETGIRIRALATIRPKLNGLAIVSSIGVTFLVLQRRSTWAGTRCATWTLTSSPSTSTFRQGKFPWKKMGKNGKKWETKFNYCFWWKKDGNCTVLFT